MEKLTDIALCWSSMQLSGSDILLVSGQALAMIVLISLLALSVAWIVILQKKYSKAAEDLCELSGELKKESMKSEAGFDAATLIRSNLAQLASLLNFDAHYIYIKDSSGKFLFVNETLAKELGFSANEMIGKKPFDLGIDDSEYRKFQSTPLQQTTGMMTMPAEVICRKDGSKFACEVLKMPLEIPGSDSLIIGFGLGTKPTDQEVNEENLKDRFFTLLSNLNGFAYRCKSDEHWTMDFVSSGCEKLTGYSSEELVGSKVVSYANIILDEDNERITREIHSAITRGLPYRMEYRIRRKDGVIRWFWEQGICVDLGGPEKSVIEGYITDITDTKKAIQTLRVTEDRLRVALEGSGFGLWDWEISTNKVYYSQEWCRILGFDISEVETDYGFWRRRLHPDDQEQFDKTIRTFINSDAGEFTSTQMRLKAKDGSWKWLRTKWRAIDFYASGKPKRVVGTTIDVTDQIISEAALKKRLEIITSPKTSPEELEFTQIFDVLTLQKIQDVFASAVGVASVITDPQGNPITTPSNCMPVCNEMVKGTKEGCKSCVVSNAEIGRLGMEAPALIRCSSVGFLEGGAAIRVGDRHVANWVVGQVRDEEFDEEAAMEFAKKLGLDIERFKTELESTPQMTRSQFKSICDTVYMISNQMSDLVVRNLDQAKEILKRQETERELALKNKELESIVYISSHDLRSPLVNIQGFGEELKHSSADLQELITKKSFTDLDRKKIDQIVKSEIPEFIEFIVASANKMDLLQQGLLQISRLGKAKLEMRQLDMNGLLRDIVESMQYQLRSKEVEVKVDDLPACFGDMPTVNQVFTNILDNAVKYLDETRQGKIAVSGNIEDGYAVYSVKDNGRGIDDSNVKKVFELFYRVDPQNGVSGEGLGLSLVARIINRHGGKVWLESEVGKGSTFYIQLPVYSV